jgi:hypothetical protein
MSYSEKTPTLCVIPVFSVAVMEKCCDACGDGEYLFPVVFLSVVGWRCFIGIECLNRKTMGHTVGEL